MKALILVLALVCATTAFAREGHEGPEATLPMPSPVIAKVVSGSGFVPPNIAVTTTVQIHSNGVIERVRMFRGGVLESAVIATLAPDVAAQVAKTSKAVKQTEIRDPQPASPGCMDAPSTHFIAVHGRKEIVIAARENCKEMEKVDESDADRSLKRTLSAAAALANVAP